MARLESVIAVDGFDYTKPIATRACACVPCHRDGQHAPVCSVHADPAEPCDCETREAQ